MLAGCSDITTTEPEADGPNCLLLVDDDSRPDQVNGEPGTYALTARGSGSPPLAVLDAPAGFSNFGFFALWPYTEVSGQLFRSVHYWTVDGGEGLRADARSSC